MSLISVSAASVFSSPEDNTFFLLYHTLLHRGRLGCTVILCQIFSHSFANRFRPTLIQPNALCQKKRRNQRTRYTKLSNIYQETVLEEQISRTIYSCLFKLAKILDY